MDLMRVMKYTEIGAGLSICGILFMILGIIMFFDGGLLAIGNLLFLAGLTLMMGFKQTYAFFIRPQKLRGSLCFLGGIVLVLFKWPIIGMLVELFGVLNLFGDFFPVVVRFGRGLPIIGPILNMPGISKIVDSVAGTKFPV